MYKRKAQKVWPVNSSVLDSTTPGGMLDWRAWIRARLELENEPFDLSLPGKYGGHLIPRFSRVRPGSRLTPERVEKMLVGDNVWPKERAFLMELLANREATLSWDFTKIGQVRPEVAPPQQIRTIPHDAWQAASFAIPKALTGKVVEMLRERLKNGVLEPCHGPYRNPWFLVKKKGVDKYRMVNAAMSINKVTIWDANLPPAVDEFSEEFAGMAVASLIDFFSSTLR